MNRAALRWALAAVAIVGPAVLAVALTEDPDGPVLCGFRALFGIPCPGCGMTRSLSALIHGDVVTAFRVHPAGPVFLVYLGGLWLTAWWSYARKGQLRSPLAQAIPGWAHAAIVLGMIAVWVVRFFGLLGGPASPVDPAHSLLLARLFG